MTTVSLQIVGIIEPIIQHADWFFPGGTCQFPHVGTEGQTWRQEGHHELEACEARGMHPGFGWLCSHSSCSHLPTSAPGTAVEPGLFPSLSLSRRHLSPRCPRPLLARLFLTEHAHWGLFASTKCGKLVQRQRVAQPDGYSGNSRWGRGLLLRAQR